MLSRARDFLAALFRRKPPEAGRWTRGAKFAWRGWLSTLPWLVPRREYLLYEPAGWSRWRRAPLVVFCHGCKQTPEEFAQGTRIAAMADRLGWLVLMPRQMESANAWHCWNWFDRAIADGRGEAAIVGAMIRGVRRWHRCGSGACRRRRHVGRRRARGGARPAGGRPRARGRRPLGVGVWRRAVGIHRDRRDAARARDRRRGRGVGSAPDISLAGAAARDSRRGRQRGRDRERDGARSSISSASMATRPFRRLPTRRRRFPPPMRSSADSTTTA